MAVVASLSSTFACELRTLFVAHQPASCSASSRSGVEEEGMCQRRAVTQQPPSYRRASYLRFIARACSSIHARAFFLDRWGCCEPLLDHLAAYFSVAGTDL